MQAYNLCRKSRHSAVVRHTLFLCKHLEENNQQGLTLLIVHEMRGDLHLVF